MLPYTSKGLQQISTTPPEQSSPFPSNFGILIIILYLNLDKPFISIQNS